MARSAHAHGRCSRSTNGSSASWNGSRSSSSRSSAGSPRCSTRRGSRLAAYVGAAPGNLVFAPNTTSALNAVVRSLELGPGDEVLLGDAEYGGLLLLWEYVRRQHRRDARAAAVRGARARPAHARRLLLARRVDDGSRQRPRPAPPRSTRGRCVEHRRRRARAGPDRPRPRGARRRRVRGQLPQVALRAEGLGVPLCAARRRRS